MILITKTSDQTRQRGMYVCMCVCMYVFIKLHICMYVCMYIYILCMYEYFSFHATRIGPPKGGINDTCYDICMYVCMYVFIIYVCMHVYMYVYLLNCP